MNIVQIDSLTLEELTRPETLVNPKTATSSCREMTPTVERGGGHGGCSPTSRLAEVCQTIMAVRPLHPDYAGTKHVEVLNDQADATCTKHEASWGVRRLA